MNEQTAQTPACALYTTAQVRALDALAMQGEGVTGSVLMQRAAEAAFGVLRQRWPEARRVVVLCGPGNNGGDGYRLAALARKQGCEVTLLALAEASGEDAAAACRHWLESGGEVGHELDAEGLRTAEVIVDGLFGSGLSRALEGRAAQWVEAANASGAPILALDVPSGLDADSGHAEGMVIQAAATACFVAWKRGLFTARARACCGIVSLHTLGLSADLHATQTADAELMGDTRLAPRVRDSHKGRFGHVLVVGGDLGMGGAAALAGEAALRGGAGLVSVATRPEHVGALLARRPELMVRGINSARQLGGMLKLASVILIGPGLHNEDWGHDLLRACLVAEQPLVLDADALNLLAVSPWDFSGRPAVLTPHPGEAGRLLGTDTMGVQTDRFGAARELARRFQAVVALKGAGTLVADPEGRVAVCPNGNPGLASGGTGDVLGGLVAALLAQHLTPWQAACLAVDLHARAGDLAARDGERGMLAGDLFAPLRQLLNRQVE